MAHNTRVDSIRGNFNWYAAPPDYMDMNVYGDGLNANPYQNIATTSSDKLPLMIGTLVQTFDGRRFKYIKYTDAGASAAVGNVLTPVANVTAANITAYNNTADDPYVTDSGQTWTVGAYRGFWCNIGTGTAPGETRRIVWNSADTIYLERPFLNALNVDWDLIIWSPDHCARTPGNALNSEVSGVSTGAITTAQYGWMQVYGFCEGVMVDASVTGNKLIVPSNATAGQAEVAVGAATVDETFFGRALQAGGTNQLAPAFLFACSG